MDPNVPPLRLYRPRERGRTQGWLTHQLNAKRLRRTSFGPSRGRPPLVLAAPNPAIYANPTTVAMDDPRASRGRICFTVKITFHHSTGAICEPMLSPTREPDAFTDSFARCA